MAKILVLSKNEVLARRAANWEKMYVMRQYVLRACAEDSALARRVHTALSAHGILDYQIMTGDASGVYDRDVSGCAVNACLSLGGAFVSSEHNSSLLNSWLWSDDGWRDFERQFNALPDVLGDCRYSLNSAGYPLVVPVEKVGRNSGKTPVKPRRNSRQNGEFYHSAPA